MEAEARRMSTVTRENIKSEYSELEDDWNEDVAPAPAGSGFASCCGGLVDTVVWAAGCKHEAWFLAIGKPSSAADVISNHSSTKEYYVFESEWQKVHKWLLFPVAPRKTLFDLLVLVCVILSCMVVPYRAAFDDEATGPFLHLDLLVQLIFCVDLALNFNTAFLHHDQWVIHRPTIARHYLRGWFWVDAPASLPLLELYSLMRPDSDVIDPKQLLLLRALRLFRLLRLLKILKLGEAVRSLEHATGVDLTGLQALNVVLLVGAFTHLAACVFYAASVSSTASYGQSWAGLFFEVDGGGAAGTSAGPPPFERYIVCVLWALGLVTGINADVQPENHLERLVALVLYVVAVLLNALIVAVVTQHVIAYASDPFNTRMAEVESFCRFHRVSRGLREKTRAFFEATYTNPPIEYHTDLIDRMTPNLAEQMWTHLLATSIKRIDIFAKIADGPSGGGGKLGKMFADARSFHIAVYRALKYVTYGSGERLITQGEMDERVHDKVFFLRRGEIVACSGKHQLFSLAEIGTYCGERCLLDPPEAERTDFEARSRCDIFSLSRTDLINLCAEQLVPAHRLKLTGDLHAEMVRKLQQVVVSLKMVAWMIKNKDSDEADDIRDEIEETAAVLKQLRKSPPEEALSILIEKPEADFSRASSVFAA